jgi:hypothetical protein
MEAINVIYQMPENKAQIKSFVEKITTEIVDAESPLRLLKQLKMVEKTIKGILENKDVDAACLAEAEKWHKEELNGLYGCKFDIKEVGVKYDFSCCNDAIWEDLVRQEAEIKSKIKERELMLKSIKTGTEVFCEETGVRLMPPAKYSTTKVTVTL